MQYFTIKYSFPDEFKKIKKGIQDDDAEYLKKNEFPLTPLSLGRGWSCKD